MRYCHECGAQVAPQDTFCAFCGIALQPIAIAPVSPQATPVNASVAEFLAEIADSPAPVNKPVISAERTGAASLPIKPAINGDEPDTVPGKVVNNDLGEDESEPDTYTKTSQPEDLLLATPTIEAKAVETEAVKPGFDEFAQTIPTGARFDSQEFEDVRTSARDLNKSAAMKDVLVESDELPTLLGSQTPLPAAVAVPETPPGQQPTPAESTAQPVIEKPKSPPTSDMSETLMSSDLDQLRTEARELANAAQSDKLKKGGKPAAASKDGNLPEMPPQAKPALAADKQNEQVIAPVEASPLGDDANAPKPAASTRKPEAAPPPRTETAPPPKTGSTSGPAHRSSSTRIQSLPEGTLLNRRYEIVRRIGGGGMGAVYLAGDRNLGGVQRAVKEMVQAHVDDAQHEKAVQDFRRESLLLTSLEHNAIPTIYDYFYDENAGKFYLVMRYISGGDLAGKLRAAKNNQIAEETVVNWAIQVADVLDYLHNRQPPIIYRDLKPSNIMLDGDRERVMLVDFGIARWVNKEEKGVTAVGTMGYAPPELFSGNADPRSDVYSLGATMFHLLTGADPQNNPLLIFDFTKNPRPRQINPALSKEIEDILIRSVEYNLHTRFSSAAEMREILIKHLEKLRAGQLTVRDPSPRTAIQSTLPPQVTGKVFCGFCGESIAATDVFCAFCGSKQTEAEQVAAQAAMIGFGRVTAQLVVIGTNDLDAPAFSLEKESNLVGREDRRSNIFPEIDLTRYDPFVKVSRRHARIWRQGANFMVEDLDSANGTTVLTDAAEAGVQLRPFQPHALTSGDRLRLGETTLHFVAK